MTTLVEISVDDGVALIALNRPEVRNAINDALRAEFIAALERVASDEGVRAVVLTGNGKSFCAGGDISGMNERLKAPAGEVAFNGCGVRADPQERCPAAWFAEARDRRGKWRGGGAGLRHGARLRFHRGCRNAQFTMSFVKRGLVSDGGGMYFLPRRVGLRAPRN